MVVLTGLAVVGMLFLGSREPSGGPAGGAGGAVVRPAPEFALPSTGGGSVSLEDLRGGEVLLYFSEGVGCDTCFIQMVELERNASLLAARDLTVIPIVVNPLPDVALELDRFGITTPFLVDADRRVSDAYGVLGTGMHAGLPGHTFFLVDAAGTIRWERAYPSMFVETPDLLGQLDGERA